MRFIYKVLKNSILRFYNDNYFYHVAALTYVTLLGIVPFFAIILFVLTKFALFDYFVNSANQYILSNFVPSSAVSINSYFQVFITQALKLPIFSIIFFLISSIMLITTIQDTLNNIWHVEKKPRSLKQWLFAVVILFVAPIVIGMGVAMTSYFISMSWIQLTVNYFKIASLLIFFISILINTFILSLVYIVIPNTKVKIKNGIIGAAVAACLFEIAKFSFATFIQSFHSYQIIYGNFAIFPIFLLWLYICWVIILFGAIVARAMSL